MEDHSLKKIFLKILNFFRAALVHSKTERKGERSTVHPSPHMHSTPVVTTPPQSGALHTRTHLCPQKSVVSIRITVSGLHSTGLGKCILTCMQHYSAMWSSVVALKILCAPLVITPTRSQLLAPSSAFCRMSDSWNHAVAFQISFFHLAVTCV